VARGVKRHLDVLPSYLPKNLSSGVAARATLVFTKADCASIPDPPLLMLGTVLAGTYELRGLLGSGGMGQVFDAYDLNLDRPVAVKVARPATADALRVEGRALAMVKHPSVVGVFHSGVHAGRDYLVLERIAGPTLREHLNDRLRVGGPLPLRTVVAYARGMAEALAVVHEAGLAHRDLKPENVMLSNGSRVVLTDFGLTRSELVQADDDMTGTPNYMAPEVITRCLQRGAGHLVDLYALGIVAYEMIIGRTPFDRGPWDKTLHAHVFEPPPDPRALRPDVPDPLARLVLDLLAKEPDARPESADVVAARLAWNDRVSASRTRRRPTKHHVDGLAPCER
jgi:serine/threonine protein kinase